MVVTVRGAAGLDCGQRGGDRLLVRMSCNGRVRGRGAGRTGLVGCGSLPVMKRRRHVMAGRPGGGSSRRGQWCGSVSGGVVVEILGRRRAGVRVVIDVGVRGPRG